MKMGCVEKSVHSFENWTCSTDACSMFLVLFLRVAKLHEKKEIT